MTKEKLLEKIYSFTEGNHFSVMSEQENIARFILSTLDEEKAELVKCLKSRLKEVPKILHVEKLADRINMLRVIEEAETHNQTIQSIIEHIEK
jgi:hypothetical protein